MPGYKIAILPTTSLQGNLFTPESDAVLAELGEVVRNEKDEAMETPEVAEMIADCDGVMTSWGVKRLDAEAVANAGKLKVVAHAAGTVKPVVSDELWAKGVRVSSGACKIAVEVAEDALGKLICGLKDIFRLSHGLRDGGWWEARNASWARSLGRKKVGIVSASHVGKHMMKLLTMFDCEVLLYDPTVSVDDAAGWGARKVEFDELCSESDAISIHAPSIPATSKMFGVEAFARMRDRCVIVNTARGSVIDEKALIAELQKGRLYALLDVTDPEPPADDSPFRKLENVLLTPHVAGGPDNRWRIGLHAAREIARCLAGEPMEGEVTKEMLANIA